MTRNKKSNSGFIALMSAVIISVLLLLMAANLGTNGFYNRFNILDSELKERSSALAEACADTALLKLANDSTYVGPETVIVSGTDTCTIDTTTPINPRVFNVHANYNNSYTNLQITIDVPTVIVNRWEEIP
jgi:hypothetical protein